MYVPTGRGTETRLVDPGQCPNGHPWRARRSFRRWARPCRCAAKLHHVWTCNTCEAEVWEPPPCGEAGIGAGDYFRG